MSTAAAEPARIRASDPEREEYATVLRAAVTEGRLSLAEGDERLAAVYAARYRDELRPLTTDLPGEGRDALWRTPEALAAMRSRLRRHGVFVGAVAAILIGLWVLSGAHVFWPLLPLLLLSFGLMRRARFARYARSGSWRGYSPGGPPWVRR